MPMPLKESFVGFLILCITVTLSFADPYKDFAEKIEPLKKLRGSFTFAVIGDKRSNSKEYEALLHRMMEYSPAFVINTGDMIGAANRKQWAQFWQKSKTVTIPYFLTAGNHDAYDAGSEKLYRRETALLVTSSTIPSAWATLYLSFWIQLFRAEIGK